MVLFSLTAARPDCVVWSNSHCEIMNKKISTSYTRWWLWTAPGLTICFPFRHVEHPIPGRAGVWPPHGEGTIPTSYIYHCPHWSALARLWYFTRSDDAHSAKFKVTNGVRQGGTLSPYLFDVYVDELSENLNKCNVGCNLNEHLINHKTRSLKYRLISPSSAGLS